VDIRGYGDITRVAYVKFKTPFKSIPQIYVSPNFFDIYSKNNFRLNVYYQNVTKEGFEIVFFKWYNTYIHGISALWLAIG
jgi:hypothetical protein